MKNKDFYTVNINGTDRSLQVKDFVTPAVPMSLTAGQKLYVGYYKQFRQFYMHFSTLNTEAVNVSFKYYNGSTWEVIPTVIDETENFIKSGFVYFDRPTDWVVSDILNDELFYVEISADADLSLTTALKGLNVLLSNDLDLEAIRSNIVTTHNSGNPWIEKHEAARKHIIQQLNNMGVRKVKINETSPIVSDGKETIFYSNLTAFDLLEPFELREASKYFALSFIYLDELSDEEDDKWERAGLRHERRAEQALNVFMLQFDEDDDGEEDMHENEGHTRTRLVWV